MSWNPRRKQCDHQSEICVESDDDVKMGIARPAIDSSDDDESYYDRHRHLGTRGRRSHLIDQGPIKDDRSNGSRQPCSSPPPPPYTSPSNVSTYDEKAIYRQASDMIDQQSFDVPSSRTLVRGVSTASSSAATKPFNSSISPDEKEIYRQASDMIDQFASTRNLVSSATAESNSNIVARPSVTDIAGRKEGLAASSTHSRASVNSSNNAHAAACESGRRPGAFAVPGPGSTHTLIGVAEDLEDTSVAMFASAANSSSQQQDQDNEMSRAKGVVPPVPPTVARRAGAGRQRATTPGAQYVRGIAPGVRITNYLDYMRRESNRMIVQQPTVPESSTAPIVPMSPMSESYSTDEEQDKSSRRKWIILIVLVLSIVAGVAVGVPVAVTGKDKGGTINNNGFSTNTTNNNDTSSTLTPIETTTPFGPYTSDCKLLKSQSQPHAFSQCLCKGEIATVAKDVAALYSTLKQSFASTLFQDFHENITSCSPRNQALVWLSSGDGGGSSTASTSFLQQRFSLALLFILWNGNHWKSNSGWLSISSECDWYGIGCNDLHQVTSLELGDLNVTGELSAELALLTSLQSIELSKNQITGIISTQLGLLVGLHAIKLISNGVNGTLPSELGQLTNLQSIQLTSNRIHGTIPTEFATLVQLIDVGLSNNNLTGKLPTQIGLWQAVQIVNLEQNQLDSMIPTEIGMMTSLLNINLRENKFNGNIPTQLSNLAQTLQFVDFSENDLSGTIPTGVGQLDQLLSFDLHSNNITGIIPSELGMCTNLAVLEVSDNQLHGSMPAELGHLTKLYSLNVDGNRLTGQVPESVCRILFPVSCIPTLACIACQCVCHHK